MPTFLQKAATAAGNLLNSGARPGAQSLFGNSIIDVSKTLQDYGSSGIFQIARPTYAAETPQNTSQYVAPRYNEPYGLGGGGGMSGGTAQNPYVAPKTTNDPTQQNPNDLINQNVQSGNDSIERDFNDAIAQADTAEQGLRSQAGQATSELNTQGTQTRNALEQQRGTAEAGIAGQEQTAQTQAKTSMQQARDLFRQTQQQNIAQLSALGLSSSSVMEGLAEKLGVETAKRIGGVTGSLDEVMQNLSKERARVNDYAKTKLTELESNLQNQIAGIQSQLIQGIRQIQDSRQMAATAKANARADLMTQARNQLYNYQNAAQQFAQEMEQWRQTKESTLADASKQFTITPTDFTNLNNAQSNIQSITGVGGQLAGYQPSYSIAPTGKFSTTLTPKKTDELVNPFQ